MASTRTAARIVRPAATSHRPNALAAPPTGASWTTPAWISKGADSLQPGPETVTVPVPATAAAGVATVVSNPPDKSAVVVATTWLSKDTASDAPAWHPVPRTVNGVLGGPAVGDSRRCSPCAAAPALPAPRAT